jgi:hypothetical protein
VISGYAYTSDGESLCEIDLRDPRQLPDPVCMPELPALDIAGAADGRLFVSTPAQGLRVLRREQPGVYATLGSYATGGATGRLAVDSPLAWVVVQRRSTELQLLDIRAADPRLLATADLPSPYPEAVEARGQLLFVAAGPAGLLVYRRAPDFATSVYLPTTFRR